MKKIFPIIIALITISLIGLIIMQYNWFTKTLQVNEENLREKIVKGIDAVGRELSEEKNGAVFFKKLSPSQFNLGGNDELNISRPFTLAQRFTEFDIKEKLKNSFEKDGLKNINFEFAIAKDDGLLSFEMQTAGFAKNVVDTIKNRPYFYPLETHSGTQYEGLIPNEELVVVILNPKKLILSISIWQIVGSIFFTLFIMFSFFITLRTMINQKKLSEIKSDFINNMTHEFKTPLATISLAVDALRNEKVKANPEKMDYFNGIIKEENKRMNKHVETILQAALLEKQEFTLNKEMVNMHDLIHSALDNHHLVLEEKKGTVNLKLNADIDLIEADEQHFTNLLSNLIDNAIKYCKEVPEINISTYNADDKIFVKIEDKGIGMSRENVKRVFEKFFRAHTGNVHNVKGFGLGMSYVKTIIDAHKGNIKVDSILGTGTTFTIEVKTAQPNNNGQ